MDDNRLREAFLLAAAGFVGWSAITTVSLLVAVGKIQQQVETNSRYLREGQVALKAFTKEFHRNAR